VKRALELAPLDAPLCVRLHPADLEPIHGRLEALLPAGHGADVEWIADAQIERGGFRIDAPARLIDGRTDVSLRALYDRLDDV
jgi:flagellar biosynthesis/type III secretory pathway protein FliH